MRRKCTPGHLCCGMIQLSHCHLFTVLRFWRVPQKLILCLTTTCPKVILMARRKHVRKYNQLEGQPVHRGILLWAFVESLVVRTGFRTTQQPLHNTVAGVWSHVKYDKQHWHTNKYRLCRKMTIHRQLLRNPHNFWIFKLSCIQNHTVMNSIKKSAMYTLFALWRPWPECMDGLSDQSLC